MKNHRLIGVFASLMIVTIAGRVGHGQCPNDWLPGEGRPGVTGDGPVSSLTTWDPDGDGPQAEILVAAGGFDGASDVAVDGIATWDGSTWQTLGPGDPPGITGSIWNMEVYNGDLIVGGNMTAAGGVPVSMIARFDGKTWHPLGSGVGPYPVRVMAVYNGELYAGGLFTDAGGVAVNGIARWNGSSWQNVGSGLNAGAGVTALTVFNGKLIVGGAFSSAGGVPASRFASWDGTSWQSMDGGITNFSAPDELAVYNGQLIAGAMVFTSAGSFLRSISKWNGTTWVALGPGNTTPNDVVFELIEFQGALYAGGVFTSAGGVPTPNRMARWNGSTWSSVPSGPGNPHRTVGAFEIFNGDLIAGGTRTEPSGLPASEIGRWDGVEWNYLGTGINAIVYDLATYKGDLIAGGAFSTAGDIEAFGLARRDSAGAWHSIGEISAGGFIFDLIVYNDVLIASGSFSAIDGIATPNSVAQWNGETWAPFGNAGVGKKIIHDGVLYAPGAFGTNQHVARYDPATQKWVPLGTFVPNVGITSLTVFEGDLIAGGLGGIGLNASVWRWDLDADPQTGVWAPVGQHLGFNVIQTLGVYDGELFVGGYSDSFGGPPGGLAKLEGNTWVQFAGGLYLGNDMPDEILAVFDLRVHNGELVVAGTFSYAGAQQYDPDGVEAYHIVRWNGKEWLALGSGTNNAVVTLHEHNGDVAMGGWFDMAGDAPNGYFAMWGSTCGPGDVNGDGAVNVDDLLTVINGWGACPVPPGTCLGDLNGDGDVDVDDLLIVINNWD